MEHVLKGKAGKSVRPITEILQHREGPEARRAAAAEVQNYTSYSRPMTAPPIPSLPGSSCAISAAPRASAVRGAGIDQ